MRLTNNESQLIREGNSTEHAISPEKDTNKAKFAYPHIAKKPNKSERHAHPAHIATTH